MQHSGGAPSRARVAVVDGFTGELLGDQNGLWKACGIVRELGGEGPVEAADACDHGGLVAVTDLKVSAESGGYVGCLDLAGNLGEDSGGIHPQNGVIAVIQPPSQMRHGATISQGRDYKVGAVVVWTAASGSGSLSE